MIDIHAHIIPDIDDGAKDSDTSLKMLRMAAADGITHMIATPHSLPGEYAVEFPRVKEKVDRLNEYAEKENLGIKVYTGTEWSIGNGISKRIKENFGCPLAGSRYVLVEIPLWQDPEYYKSAFYELMLDGYVPVFAHPERYGSLHEKPELLERMISKGVLMQVNATSITGLEGRAIKRFVYKMISRGQAHFVASDAHGTGRRPPKLSGAYNIVKRRFGQDTTDALFIANGMSVINDEKIIIREHI